MLRSPAVRGCVKQGVGRSAAWKPASRTDRNTQAVITTQNICTPQWHSETHTRADTYAHTQKCSLPPAPHRHVPTVFTCMQNASIPHVHLPINNKTSTSWRPQRIQLSSPSDLSSLSGEPVNVTMDIAMSWEPPHIPLPHLSPHALSA